MQQGGKVLRKPPLWSMFISKEAKRVPCRLRRRQKARATVSAVVRQEIRTTTCFGKPLAPAPGANTFHCPRKNHVKRGPPGSSCPLRRTHRRRRPFSAGRDVERRRREFRAVFGACHQGRTVPVRRNRSRGNRAYRTARIYR